MVSLFPTSDEVLPVPATVTMLLAPVSDEILRLPLMLMVVVPTPLMVAVLPLLSRVTLSPGVVGTAVVLSFVLIVKLSTPVPANNLL